jgi:F0F1-type ATP synthase membrane subunit b/b'
MYFFNYKPTKENLDKQTGNIESIKKETELRVEELRKSQNEVSNSIQNLKVENKNILENLKFTGNQEADMIKRLFAEKQKIFDERIKSEVEKGIKEIGVKISAIERTAVEKISSLEEKNRKLDIQTTWDMHYMWEAKNVPVNTLASIVSTLEKTIDALKTSTFYEYYFDLCLTKLPKVIDDVKDGSPRIFPSLPETLSRLEACISLIRGRGVQKEVVVGKILSLRAVLV